MAKKRYKVDILSVSSMEQLKKDLQAYQNDLQKKLVLVCQKLSELGVEVAKASVVNLDAVFTGELYNSISYEQKSASKDKVIFAVVANNSHALYVEMGTGIVGAESPYLGKLPAVYAQGKTIRQLADGRYGWFYQRDGQWYFTEGMPSRPFMYFASMEMYEKAVKIVREVFA